MSALIITVISIVLSACGGSGNDKNHQSSSGASSSSPAATYTLVYSADSGGSISGEASQNVAAGSSGSSVIAKPANNYRFAGWSDGSFKSQRTDGNIQTNTSLTARFKAADIWSTAPYEGNLALEIDSSSSVTVTWRGGQRRTLLISHNVDLSEATTLTDVTSPYQLQDLVSDQPLYVATREDDVITAWSSTTPRKIVANYPINSIQIGADDTRYLGGYFTMFGALQKSTALLPLPGSAQTAPLAFPETDDYVTTAQSDGSGGWYLGGLFTRIGDQERIGFAHINARGEITSWAPGKGTVHNIYAYENRVFIVESSHDSWNPTTTLKGYRHGASEPDLNMPLNNSSVEIIRKGDILYIAQDNSQLPLVAYDLSGNRLEWSPPLARGVKALATLDELIFVATGESSNNLRIYNESGELIRIIDYIYGEIKQLQADDQYIYASGYIDVDKDRRKSQIIRIDKQGNHHPFKNSLTVAANDAILVHEQVLYFTAHGAPGDKMFGKGLQAYSLRDDEFIPWESGASEGIHHLTISDKTLLTSGIQRVAGGKYRRALASFNADDQLTDWKVQAIGYVSSLSWFNGTLYAGGKFDIEGALPRSHLAAFDMDGFITDWQPDTHPYNSSLEINIIKTDSSGVYAGGLISASDLYQSQAYLLAIDHSGSALHHTRLHFPEGERSSITDIALINDKIFFTGPFTRVNNKDRFGIAAVDKAGNLLHDHFENLIYKSTTAMANNGNKIYVTGTYSISPSIFLQKFDANTNHSNWSKSWGMDWAVPIAHSISTYADKILIGGHNISMEKGLLVLNEKGEVIDEGNLNGVTALEIKNNQLFAAHSLTIESDFDSFSYNQDLAAYKAFNLKLPLGEQ
ncbi:hypothetical protein C4F51_05760 [Cellvibrio sp. KB43]|uniref:Bacterial repeat domain-containing protein n=1 Tax=Cellvibrio polysaccharolyticus TaxID=2082724 RepID=A0A928V0X0_9GAMM|nr:hypothetical protein [Cellvibrio polysaccharolyticus]